MPSMSSITYVRNNELQPEATMSRELASKCTFTCSGLSLPKRNASDPGDNSHSNQFPNDYYTGNMAIEYPDGNRSGSMLLPNVVVYNSPREVGGTTRYPLGFKRSDVAYLETAFKKAYPAFRFAERRYSSTPEYVWVELRLYNPRPNRPSNKVEVVATRTVKGERHTMREDSIRDFFEKFNSVVAVEFKMSTSMKLQAEVPKGTSLNDNTEAKPVFIPNQLTVIKPVNVPEPATIGPQKAVITEADDADDSFWKLADAMGSSTIDGSSVVVNSDDEFED